MLTLAFDTATSVATSALVRDGDVLAERASRAGRVLADVDDLMHEAGAGPREISALAVGTGPGSFTGVRLGLAAARALAFSLDLQVAGVSTLDALAAGAPDALPIVDAGRREVFTLVEGNPIVAAPEEIEIEPGTVCVGDGAVRYRDRLETKGAVVPDRDDVRHVPRARFHAQLAREFGPADSVEPLYLRVPDVETPR
jgi:tRNA threonylcarbamoyladenosine biosynthesis protein TsaB